MDANHDWLALARLIRAQHPNPPAADDTPVRQSIQRALDEADRRAAAGDRPALAQARHKLLPAPVLIPPKRFPERLTSLRFVAQRLNGIEVILPPLCDVPAGAFLMGSDPQPWAHLSLGDAFDPSRANTADDQGNARPGLGKTTPVSTYPSGASPYSVQDTAAAVWEWISTRYQPHPYNRNDWRESLDSIGSRVLRGGSWNDPPRFARGLLGQELSHGLGLRPRRADLSLGGWHIAN